MKILHSLTHGFLAVKKYAVAHKFISGIAALVIIGGGWWGVSALTQAPAEVHYVLGTVAQGTIISTVSASGQVSASREVDIKPQVSGTITYIGVKAGQTVKSGQLIAEVDPTDAEIALRNAQNSLDTAELNLAKLQEPASGLTLLQTQNAVTTAQDSLAQSYTDSESDIVAAFLALPDLMSSFQDIVIGTTASKSGGQWNIDYYQSATAPLDNNAYSYHDAAYTAYLKAKASYTKVLADYQAIGTNPDNATITNMTGETFSMLEDISDALKSVNSFIQFYSTTVTNHNQTPSAVATAALATLSSDITSISSKVSSASSDQSNIKNDIESLAEKQQSLQDLNAGADPLAVRSDQLAVQQAQDSVTNAQATLAEYYMRAPFDSTVATVAAYVGDQGGSTAIASLITPQQVIELSLNEVDAAKVKVGDKATLTFDAIDGLSLTGTVDEVDPVGTVSQGVVSYGVQISLDTQNDQVKPGMTVNADIQTDVHQNVLTVPSGAVKTSNNASYVLVFTPALTSTGGTQGVTSAIAPMQVPVTVGISDDTNVEILSGLTEGEQIVTRTIAAGATTPSAATRTTTATTGAARAGAGAGGFGGGAGIRIGG